MICPAPPRRRRPRGVPRIAVSYRTGVPVVSVTHDRKWDAGDLTLLCEAVERLIAGYGPRRCSTERHPIGIDLSGVGSLPTGFWDRLCRWGERGLDVFLFDPGSDIQGMLWFRLSARLHAELGAGAYAVSHLHETVSADGETGPGLRDGEPEDSEVEVCALGL